VKIEEEVKMCYGENDLFLFVISQKFVGNNGPRTLAEGFMSQSTCLQRCSILFPPLSNKIFYFYIICNGSVGKSGGHENTVKTHEIGGMNFHLKGGSGPGPTKLSIALGAEGCHRAACL